MLTVTYKDRIYLDKYRCIDRVKTQRVYSKAFTQGGLTYFKRDQFNYFVIETDNIINVVEVKNA